MLTVTDNPYFNQHKLGTRFRHIITDEIWTLRRFTNNLLEGTLFLWHTDSDSVIENVTQEEWELAEPVPEDPQALLTRVLDCIHDGDRPEILSALTDISNHIRQMHELPRVSKDVVTDTTVYIVPSNDKEIHTTTGIQDRSTEENTSQEEGVSL